MSENTNKLVRQYISKVLILRKLSKKRLKKFNKNYCVPHIFYKLVAQKIALWG
ncbi:hypothetical protein CCAND93_680069 [Capnocytophaga canis]|uniref:Uncharacterized protein n=1 Tax=Capnocytophaga canis TaxID=1848903 RepID=A0A0B7IVR8_9FLAO|nr:hypothetical protein CCAND93_680069 [Capnocytophaga canis]